MAGRALSYLRKLFKADSKTVSEQNLKDLKNLLIQQKKTLEKLKAEVESAQNRETVIADEINSAKNFLIELDEAERSMLAKFDAMADKLEAEARLKINTQTEEHIKNTWEKLQQSSSQPSSSVSDK